MSGCESIATKASLKSDSNSSRKIQLTYVNRILNNIILIDKKERKLCRQQERGRKCQNSSILEIMVSRWQGEQGESAWKIFLHSFSFSFFLLEYFQFRMQAAAVCIWLTSAKSRWSEFSFINCKLSSLLSPPNRLH